MYVIRGKIIAFANQKGGVAKSTTVEAVGSVLMNQSKTVLFIDLDPQWNLTDTIAGMRPDGKADICDLFTGAASAEELIRTTENGYIIPACDKLAGLRETMKDKAPVQLTAALAPARKDFDYILLDTPPALGWLSVNALAAADYLVVPTTADYYCLKAIGQLYTTVEVVRANMNKALSIAGILVTRYNGRTVLSRDVAEVITDTANRLHTGVFKTFIHEGVAIREAQARHKLILNYAPRSKAAIEYTAFTAELLDIIGKE